MIPIQKELEELVKAGANFYVYGPRASGKTTLLNKVFQATQIQHIRINCSFMEKKHNFLKLINTILSMYLKRTHNKLTTSPKTFDAWLNQMKGLCDRDCEKLDGLYLFMDNSQEIKVGEKFLSSFYQACRTELPFQFNFVFCGSCYGMRNYGLEQPFRSLPSFCMAKPIKEFQIVIGEAVRQIFRSNDKIKNSPSPEIQKVQIMLINQIRAGFQMVETNLKKINRITRVLVQSLLQKIVPKDPPKTLGPVILSNLHKLIHQNDLKNMILKVIEFQSLSEHQIGYKLQENQRPEDYWKKNPYYPNLIMTSIFMADQFVEADDKRRFKDYRKISNTHKKKIAFKKHTWGMTPRHNLQRIIAISQAIESQAKPNDRQRKREHHGLDYYSTFQHLNNDHLVSFMGKYSTWGCGKIQGKPNEDEVKNFLRGVELHDTQFMPI